MANYNVAGLQVLAELAEEAQAKQEFERQITLRVAAQCADMCGSQADQKNIRRHFGLDYYDGPTHYQDKRWQQSQYDWSKHYVKDERGN
jgi:hypothetical protein